MPGLTLHSNNYQAKIEPPPLFPNTMAIRLWPPIACGVCQAARGDFVERIAHTGLLDACDLGEVPVATQQDHSWYARLTDQTQQPSPRLRKVGPFLVFVFLGQDLDARDNEMDLRCTTAQLCFQPAPLLCTEHIPGGMRGFAVIARIEQEHFHLFANRTVDVRGIDALACTSQISGGHAEKIEEELLTLYLPGVLRSLRRWLRSRDRPKCQSTGTLARNRL